MKLVQLQKEPVLLSSIVLLNLHRLDNLASLLARIYTPHLDVRLGAADRLADRPRLLGARVVDVDNVLLALATLPALGHAAAGVEVFGRGTAVAVRAVRPAEGFVSGGVGHLAVGRVVRGPGVIPALELYPCVVRFTACGHIGRVIGSFPRMAGSGLDVLGEPDEQRSKDGDRTKDDDEPHFSQHPRIQRVNGVGEILSLRDRADRDGLVDSRYARAVKRSESVKLDQSST